MLNLRMMPYSGRYVLMERIKLNIHSLDNALIRQAQEMQIDLLPVSAFDIITKSQNAKQFKNVVYPVEIAKRYFPDISYRFLELSFLDRVVKVENCGICGKLSLTPTIIAKKELALAFNNVYSVVFRNLPYRLKQTKMLWEF